MSALAYHVTKTLEKETTMPSHNMCSVNVRTITVSGHQVDLGKWLYANDAHTDLHRQDIISQAREMLAQNDQLVAVELTGDITLRVER